MVRAEEAHGGRDCEGRSWWEGTWGSLLWGCGRGDGMKCNTFRFYSSESVVTV